MSKILLALAALAVLATDASADLLRCKIEGFSDSIFITSPPDTNSERRSIRADRHLPRHRKQSFRFRRPHGRSPIRLIEC
ncbi:hypothetical protein ACVWZR_007554 [Bradyrhizobium sp. i1.3.1]